jgi:serine/threonine protein kinase
LSYRAETFRLWGRRENDMTTAEQFRRVRNLFDAAIERTPRERDEFLAGACQGDRALLDEVRALIAAREQPETWIDRSPARTRFEGRRIGPYEALREIASGGMGTVYLARRADGAFEMRVALKILRPEIAHGEVLRRFQQEREILAALDHPNIARILDGGETEEGFPYLAMEFIDGLPIDRYCEERRLDVPARLRLFRAVCDAVRYAHARGVVHRDLKPSNVLVTEAGVVKLLDFGISKVLAAGALGATACATRSGLYLMTPEYASPEQVRGENVGPATDVYSLGIMLYELLTGRRPYRLKQRAFYEIVRIICEEPPTRPSTAVTQQPGEDESSSQAGSMVYLQHQLAGDLDAVVLKALEKAPGRRYRTVEALDSEIARHLLGEPVEARSPRAFDSVWRVARRHTTWIWAAAAFGALAASGAIAVKPDFLPLLLATAVSLLIGIAITRLELGKDTSRRLIATTAKGGIGGALMGALYAHLMFATPRGYLVLALAASTDLIFLYLCLRWPFRERWAGRLLLDVRRPRPAWAYLAGVVALVPIVQLISGRFDRTDVCLWIANAGLCTYLFLCYTRNEIRERGIVAYGQFLPWSRIEGRRWEDGERFAILKLGCGGFRKLWPDTVVLIPRAKKEETDRILNRYLSEWPSR